MAFEAAMDEALQPHTAFNVLVCTHVLGHPERCKQAFVQLTQVGCRSLSELPQRQLGTDSCLCRHALQTCPTGQTWTSLVHQESRRLALTAWSLSCRRGISGKHPLQHTLLQRSRMPSCTGPTMHAADWPDSQT